MSLETGVDTHTHTLERAIELAKCSFCCIEMCWKLFCWLLVHFPLKRLKHEHNTHTHTYIYTHTYSLHIFCMIMVVRGWSTEDHWKIARLFVSSAGLKFADVPNGQQSPKCRQQVGDRSWPTWHSARFPRISLLARLLRLETLDSRS